MAEDRFVGTTSYSKTPISGDDERGSVYVDVPICIARVQGFFNLVTIKGLGQGKVKFEREGTFKGTWAIGDQIFDVSGFASGSQTYWEGRFEIREIETCRIMTGGSFKVEKVS